MTPPARRLPTVRQCMIVFAAILISGFLAASLLGGTFGISRVIFFAIDRPGFIAALVLAGLAMVLARGPAGDRIATRGARVLQGLRPWHLALISLILSCLGTQALFSGYALTMDEWMPRLQARIFGAGQLTAQIAEEWRPYGRAIFQDFATYDPVTGEVASSYRPGLAALIALFDLAGLGGYHSAFLQAGAVLLVARVAAQIWPDASRAPLMAALLLATSQQALAMSMTGYAMTAHLFFNLLWLHLFLRDQIWAHVLAALVGVLTASLHQVHMHLFFALPFGLMLLRPFRPGILAIYFVIYLAGHLAVIAWDKVLIAQAAASVPGDARSTLDNIALVLRLPGLADLATIWTNLTRLIAWQNLALVPLLLIAARLGRGRVPFARLLIASMVLTLLPYIFLMPDQAHGWGYRYMHGMLGHLALLGAVGWHFLPDTERALRGFVVALCALTVLVMFPLRAVQIHAFVTPYVKATDLAHAQDSDVVVVDSLRVWVGGDIPRNDPLSLDRPVVMYLHGLTPDRIAPFCTTYDVTVLGPDAFAPLGLRVVEDLPPALAERHAALMAALAESGCIGAGQ